MPYDADAGRYDRLEPVRVQRHPRVTRALSGASSGARHEHPTNASSAAPLTAGSIDAIEQFAAPGTGS